MWIGAVNVLISGGFTSAYEKLLPEFERTSGIKVTSRSGVSQGVGPQTIAAQLARGLSAHVVMLSREGLGELMAANRIVAGTDVPLPAAPMRMWPISTRINKPENNDPSILEPLRLASSAA